MVKDFCEHRLLGALVQDTVVEKVPFLLKENWKKNILPLDNEIKILLGRYGQGPQRLS